MPNNRSSIESIIESAKPAELTAAEEAALLDAVQERIRRAPVPSPLTGTFIASRRIMIPLILILALALGTGGTVAAADGARPGDLLFPVDRAIEDFRLTLASEEGKNELRVKFAGERLREFDDISRDELDGKLAEAEADIFTDLTVVKLEAGGRTAYFTTGADTREEIIAAIKARFGFSEEEIDDVLSVETEDRASRPEDRGAEKDGERLERALDALGDFIEDNRDAASTSPEALAALALIESRLFERSGSFPEEIRVRVENDRARYEVRGEDGERVRVEVKDGEVRIKTKDGDDDRDEDEDEDDGRDEDEELEIEADVFTDETVVKVELDGRTSVFATSADTRAEVIDAVQDRFPGLSEAEIDASLDLEFEDRESRDDDRDDDSSDRDSDDDEDEDEDEDDDDDRDSSGRGSGKDDEDEDEDD